MSRKIIIAAAAMGASATAVYAGGVERSSLSTGILFEEGNYAEVSFGHVAPDVSGATAPGLVGTFGPGVTGDVAGDYSLLSFGYKNDLSDKLHLALIVDQPIGANVAYTDPSYPYGGLIPGTTVSTASVDSQAVTALLRYELRNNVSVYGGLRVQQAEGEVSLFNGYTMSTSRETDYGYILGAAWEKPEIAARVALTYQSEITHDFTSTENSVFEDGFATTVPQSVTLEFQSGIAADTLLFGSVKWAESTQFDITPPAFFGATGGSLVDYDNDVITYNLGIGRRFNEDWSAALLLGHEASQGGYSGNLGPTDGYTSIGVAVTRALGNVEITGGARYIMIGDADTEAPDALVGTSNDITLGEFRDNSGIALGLRVGYSF